MSDVLVINIIAKLLHALANVRVLGMHKVFEQCVLVQHRRRFYKLESQCKQLFYRGVSFVRVQPVLHWTFEVDAVHYFAAHLAKAL